MTECFGLKRGKDYVDIFRELGIRMGMYNPSDDFVYIFISPKFFTIINTKWADLILHLEEIFLHENRHRVQVKSAKFRNEDFLDISDNVSHKKYLANKCEIESFAEETAYTFLKLGYTTQEFRQLARLRQFQKFSSPFLDYWQSFGRYRRFSKVNMNTWKKYYYKVISFMEANDYGL
jgi:hypothetical protein